MHRKISPSALAASSTFRYGALEKTVNGTQTDDDIVLPDRTENVIVHGRDGNDIIRASQGNDLLYGGFGDDTLYAGAGDDIVYGGRGDDFVRGGDGNDILYGGAGMDNLFGGPGDDVLCGGRSFDLLMGDGGDDIFVFRRGDGSDTIFNEQDPGVRHASGRDIVHFADLKPDQLDSVRMEKEVGPAAGESFRMVLDYGQGDRVTIRYQEAQGHRAINTFRFANGAEMSASSLLSIYSGEDGTLAKYNPSLSELKGTLMKFHLSAHRKDAGGGIFQHADFNGKVVDTLAMDMRTVSPPALQRLPYGMNGVF